MTNTERLLKIIGSLERKARRQRRVARLVRLIGRGTRARALQARGEELQRRANMLRYIIRGFENAIDNQQL